MALQDGTNLPSVLRSLDGMSITRGDRLVDALKYLEQSSFTAKQGARSLASKHVILILNNVDIDNSPSIQERIKALKRAGMKMTIINTGEKPEKDDKDDDTSDPIVDVFFFPEDLDSIDRLLDRVVSAMKKGRL